VYFGQIVVNNLTGLPDLVTAKAEHIPLPPPPYGVTSSLSPFSLSTTSILAKLTFKYNSHSFQLYSCSFLASSSACIPLTRFRQTPLARGHNRRLGSGRTTEFQRGKRDLRKRKKGNYLTPSLDPLASIHILSAPIRLLAVEHAIVVLNHHPTPRHALLDLSLSHSTSTSHT
jgi:hypothetical protein